MSTVIGGKYLGSDKSYWQLKRLLFSYWLKYLTHKPLVGKQYTKTAWGWCRHCDRRKMMNATESKLVVHKTMSDSCLEIVEDDEWLTQIVATNAETETLQKNIKSLHEHQIQLVKSISYLCFVPGLDIFWSKLKMDLKTTLMMPILHLNIYHIDLGLDCIDILTWNLQFAINDNLTLHLYSNIPMFCCTLIWEFWASQPSPCKNATLNSPVFIVFFCSGKESKERWHETGQSFAGNVTKILTLEY